MPNTSTTAVALQHRGNPADKRAGTRLAFIGSANSTRTDVLRRSRSGRNAGGPIDRSDGRVPSEGGMRCAPRQPLARLELLPKRGFDHLRDQPADIGSLSLRAGT